VAPYQNGDIRHSNEYKPIVTGAADLNKFNTLAKLQPQPPAAGVTIGTTAAAKTASQQLSSSTAQAPPPWQDAAIAQVQVRAARPPPLVQPALQAAAPPPPLRPSPRRSATAHRHPATVAYCGGCGTVERSRLMPPRARQQLT